MSEHRPSRTVGSGNDDPPMSRLFVICSKRTEEDELRQVFSRFGEIDDVFIVKDRNSSENKGFAYIKYRKTSDAAKAQEEMNGKAVGDSSRPVKVLVAANRNESSKKQDDELEKYVRLFIVVSKTTNEEALREDFEKFGQVENVTVVKDRETGTLKGFGYIKYKRFYHAALAFEGCDQKYKAVFAEPKSSRNADPGGRNFYDLSIGRGSAFNDRYSESHNVFRNVISNSNSQPTTLEVVCSSRLNQDQLWRLFDLIPGLDYCQLIRERGPRTCEASVVYNSVDSATYARDKLHGFEYPPGERLIVKTKGGAVIPPIGGLKNNFSDPGIRHNSICSVALPPTQPLAPENTPCAQRCFIVLTGNLPGSILRNIFCCFGGLIEIYLLPNKNCGYVKYATAESAFQAIATLNGSEVCGYKLKVMEAEEKTQQDESSRKRMRRD